MVRLKYDAVCLQVARALQGLTVKGPSEPRTTDPKPHLHVRIKSPEKYSKGNVQAVAETQIVSSTAHSMYLSSEAEDNGPVHEQLSLRETMAAAEEGQSASNEC